MMIRYVLVAVAFLVAALVLAPADADAHAGHRHSADEASVASDATSLAPDTVAPASAGETGIAILASASSDRGRLKPCQAGCCTALSAGCCAVWFAPAPDLKAPHGTVTVFSAYREQRTGITPDVLPKPPKAQA